jgi:hypothetical protein
MASHSINLLRSKQRSDGKMQIIIKISAQGSDIIRTGIFVVDSEWDAKKRVVLGQNARLYNRSLDVLNGRIQAIFNSLFAEGKLKTATAKEIKQIFETDGNGGTPSRKKKWQAIKMPTSSSSPMTHSAESTKRKPSKPTPQP